MRSRSTSSLSMPASRLAWEVRFQARSSCSVCASISTPRGLNITLKFSSWLSVS